MAPFNEIISQLPTREKVIGQMSDGTPLTIQVPTLFPRTVIDERE